MSGKTTGDLLETMSGYDKYENYIADNNEDIADKPITEILIELLNIHSLKKADVIASSGIETHYAYQIFSGLRTPGRDKLLMLFRAMGLSLEETQAALKTSGGTPLYAKTERDNAIIFGFVKNKTVMQINEILYELALPLLE